ncbi:hypothetical protein LSH36_615g00014 [Paralvinella palmiformis]|uniref:Glutathione reductase n=1 Tax=Paralvinella palmiformis TaxID=53620 RepID=A0AAD9MWD7_9ANNE|nr:hypothetical protein LSH36_615g00014 [Paralvinella palmiformis]
MLSKKIFAVSVIGGRRCFSRYAPVYATAGKDFDYLVIGGGSGGLASAKKAAQLGAKVGIVELKKLGGTCVNVGCMPKKVLFYGGLHASMIKDHKDYGFDVTFNGFDWGALKKSREAFIRTKHVMFEKSLKADNITSIFGHGKFTEDGAVEVNGKKYTAEHTLISTGAKPIILDVPGKELGITNEGFFRLETLPKKAVVVGAGYIAVELAGILRTFGTDVSMLIQPNDGVLVTFDSMIEDAVTQNLKDSGINIKNDTVVQSIAKGSDGKLNIKTSTGVIDGADCLIWAVGRAPNADIALDKVGIETTDFGNIIVDEYQNTSAHKIYAIGDVCGKALLTPVAIQTGRKLARRLFNDETKLKMEFKWIPTVIFSHPPVGSIGMSQKEAEQKYGADKIKVYKTTFVPVYYGLTQRKIQEHMKLVCLLPEQRIIGLHIVGLDADEMLQGYAAALKIGATKKDFEETIAIHPTSSEEVVTIK